ncbi:MAG: flotillin family protein, partial [Myxococcales bacterium]|nr:flotillin family protein [Myxococcales bacterium]
MNQTYGGTPPGTYEGNPLDQLMSSPWLWTLLIAFGVVFAVLILIGIMKKFVYIARPNEALVFSGKSYVAEDGQKLGYRVVSSGMRALRIPILEQVDRLDMRILPIDIVVKNAYSKGNIPLQIHAIANVKLHSNRVVIRNAIERFLGRSLIEVQTVAQQTLEGAVREVIATMTPEEVNEDRLKFAESLILAAEDDLHVLGLQLDTLKIQNVADDTGYLDSLGRPAIANA